MKKRALIYLTDNAVSLFGPASTLLGTFDLKEEGVFEKLNSLLSPTPKVTCGLVIDRNHPTMEEERLTSLFIWERLLYLFHKKKEWENQGGYLGFQFFNHKKETFLRWMLIPESDPCCLWISWIKKLPNPFGGIFFASLEAGPFLTEMIPTERSYKMLLYTLPSHQSRYIIFNENRLLLSRLWEGNEKDIKLSLQYLSRSHPSLHEELQSLNLSQTTNLTLPNLKTFENSALFLNFLSTRKKPSLCIKPNIPLSLSLLRKGGSMFIAVLLLIAGINVSSSVRLRFKTQALLSSLAQLEKHQKDSKNHLPKQDIFLFQTAIKDILTLKKMTKDPFITLEKISHLIENFPIHLEKIEWSSKEDLIFSLSFLMQRKDKNDLATVTNAVLTYCSKLFPKGKIEVLESPHHSSRHEEFKNPLEEELPLFKVKVTLP